jgi:hypothetical protein
MGVMESAFGSELMDHYFTWLPIDLPNAEQIPFPCLWNMIQASNSQKVPGSILLDHAWLLDKNTDRDWCGRLYEWLEPLNDSGRHIAQMQRGGHEVAERFTPWVKILPETGYPQYLAQSATYETFILTHPGSYEHSIIDMAARGIRVLVPMMEGKPFCNPTIVEGLGLRTFSNREELLGLLFSPATPPPPRECFTDMPEIVAKIDAYCQGCLL